MTETTPETSEQRPDNSRNERRAARPAAGDPPPAERSFAPDKETSDKADLPIHQGLGADIQHEAVQAGHEIMLASQRAATHTSEMWRQSLEPIAAMQAEMSHWVEDMWRRMTGVGAMRPMQTARPFGGGGMMALMGAPACDLKETDSAYHLCMEVPGLRPDDLEIGLKGDVLVVAGQKSEERHDGADAYKISERRYGAFERAFPVPQNVDRAAVGARLESGLLKIDLPKTAPAAAPWSKIEVQG